MITRRAMLAISAGALLAAEQQLFVKGICSIIFPKTMPLPDKLKQAKAAGFDAVEMRIGEEIPLDAGAAQLNEIGQSAREAKIRIATLWASQPLHANPLNSASSEVRARGVADLRKCIDIARQVQCDAILLYPGSVTRDLGYEVTWERFTVELAKVVPAAAEARVYLNMENVWNRFLLSPLEMRAFVDQFKSPWLQAHFDIGNIMQYGIPQDWIRTLGTRIRRVHVKDYKLAKGGAQGRFVDLFEGDVDWKAVMDALRAVGYSGFMSPEISYRAGEEGQLETVSQQLDRILAM
ncbi:MAG: sugar phosphate isomerase/epimerase [Acidobacteriota bacterium]|nr:sugar phosphate isomerase/epimerase [Acidobacteriota bacterium]